MTPGRWQIVSQALGRGVRKRCPHCGRAPLFEGWGTHLDRCASCGLIYERNPGDTWAFTVIGDRVPVAAAIALVYFGVFRAHHGFGVAAVGVLTAILIWTSPN